MSVEAELKALEKEIKTKRKTVGRKEIRIPGLVMLREVTWNLISKPATVNYPFVQTQVPDRFRGILSFDVKKCLGCGSCAKVCPTGVIKMVPSDKTRLKKAPFFELSRCVFCGSCVDICPTKAIQFTTNYHTAIVDKAKFIIDPNKPDAEK